MKLSEVIKQLQDELARVEDMDIVIQDDVTGDFFYHTRVTVKPARLPFLHVPTGYLAFETGSLPIKEKA